MANARELLEQADALMRRNRTREPGPDIPELTDAVETFDPAAMGDDSIGDFGGSAAVPAVVAPVSLPEPSVPDFAAGPDTFPMLTEVVAVPEAVPPPPKVAAAVPPAPGDERDAAHWARVAEDVRMQVLQRIDIFTDTGLQEQLKERLQPIVDRASADLVATINRQVGQLLRAYVAEAIEREIDKWRQGAG